MSLTSCSPTAAARAAAYGRRVASFRSAKLFQSAPPTRTTTARPARVPPCSAFAEAAAARSAASRSTPRKPSSTNSARQPLRLITSSASAPVNRVLTGTRVAPAVSEPRAARTQAVVLGHQTATRSPGAMPSAMSARATSPARSCSSR
jgi:hypothetical protein